MKKWGGFVFLFIRRRKRAAFFCLITRPSETAFPVNCFAFVVLWRVFSWQAFL